MNSILDMIRKSKAILETDANLRKNYPEKFIERMITECTSIEKLTEKYVAEGSYSVYCVSTVMTIDDVVTDMIEAL